MNFLLSKDFDKEDAKTILKLIYKNQNSMEVLDRVGYFQSQLKDYENCIETLNKCLQFSNPAATEQIFNIRANLAKMYNNLNDPEQSIYYSNLNYDLNNDKSSLMEISLSYYLLGNYNKSEQILRKLLKSNSNDLRINYNLATYDIENGNFKEGFKKLITTGHKLDIWKHKYIKNIKILENNNYDKNKSLLIHGEGGIGDELIMFRFIKQLNLENIIWKTNHKNLVEVFTRHGCKTVLNNNNVDYQCLSMYLPIILDLEKDQLWNGPYLTPSEFYLEKWNKILSKYGNTKKLALKWAGSNLYEQDLHRTIPLDIIKDIEYDGVKINLQLEKNQYQENMFNANEYIQNIEDTLALLCLCNDVLTSCTSIIHMCGAMDIKATVCPPIARYYVWLDDYPWYSNNIKVVPQTKHKDWSHVRGLFKC